MISQFDFTTNEWSDIATLPVLVGYAIAMAEDSGRVGSYLEARTLVHSIAAGASKNAAHSLIQAVSLTNVKDKVEAFEENSPELLADIAVQAAATIASVLDEKADPDECTAYKQWVLDIAFKVADAARENGVRVSEHEQALLDRLQVVLAP